MRILPFFLIGCEVSQVKISTQEPLNDGVFLVDEDGDGVGASGAVTQACFQGRGFSELSGDCDDQNAAVFPGADEICNDIDDDCDGFVDDADDSLAPGASRTRTVGSGRGIACRSALPLGPQQRHGRAYLDWGAHALPRRCRADPGACADRG